MKNIKYICLILALFTGLAQANPEHLKVLDPVYYMNLHPDLKAAFNSDIERAKQHWLTHGINEGRDSAPWFSLKGYCQRQEPGFQAHFGNCSNYRGLMDHYIAHGRAEGRKPFPAGQDDPRLHVFDAQFYLDKHPDVKQHFGNHAAAQQHWLQYGINEGRQGSYGFSAKAYLDHNPDLRNHFGTNYSGSISHFHDHGRREGRNFTPSNTASATISGNVDPIAEIVKVAPTAGALLNPLKGIFMLNNASAANLETNEVFAIEGQFNTQAVQGNHLVATMLRTAGLASKNLFGVPETVKMKAGLVFANNEWDLSLAINIVDTFKTLPIPGAQQIGVGVAFKDADLVLHAKMPGHGGVPTVSTELTGSFFFKPTGLDPWLALNPTTEINNLGELTVGGALVGVCGDNINAGTQFNQCTQNWNVMKLGVLEAQGGVLKLTFDPKTPSPHISGIETAIQNGKFNKTLDVDGALITDLDASPGFGVALKVRQTDPVTFLKAMPFANQEPFAAAFNAIPSGMSASADRRIIITPTAMSVGHHNYPKPTFEFGTSFQGFGMNSEVTGKLQGDIIGALNGHTNDISTYPELQMKITPPDLKSKFGDELNTIPLIRPLINTILSQFSFDGLDITTKPVHPLLPHVQITVGTMKARILGQSVNVELPAQDLFKPDQMAIKLAEKAKDVAGSLSEQFLRGLQGGAEFIASGGKQTFEAATKAAEDAANAVGGAVQEVGETLNPTNWW